MSKTTLTALTISALNAIVLLFLLTSKSSKPTEDSEPSVAAETSKQAKATTKTLRSYQKLKDFFMFRSFDLSDYPNGDLVIWATSNGEKHSVFESTLAHDRNAELYIMPNFDRDGIRIFLLSDNRGSVSTGTNHLDSPVRFHQVDSWSGQKGHLLAETYDKKSRLWGIITPADHEFDVNIERQLARIEEEEKKATDSTEREETDTTLTSARPPTVLLKGTPEIFNEVTDFKNDFGGTPSQSFTPSKTGKLTGIELSISGKENPRELLVVFRGADENGYPSGNVICSATTVVYPEKPTQLGWHPIAIDAMPTLQANTPYTFTLIPSRLLESFGYFEYAYSDKNVFPSGRLHKRSNGRTIPKDSELDLAFRIFIEPDQ